MTRLWSMAISVVVLAGCAAGSRPSTAPITLAPASAEEAPMSSQLASGKPGQMPPMRDLIEITGVVEMGVENGCRLLRTGDALFQLTGSMDPLIVPGARLIVSGRPRPDLATTCQQGTPFQVTAVRAE